MRVNVKNMQRVPHVHRSAVKNVKINGRYVCDTCPYRWSRPKSVGTTREMYDFEKKMILKESLPTMTVPKLREMLLKNNPNAKGVSKMRKDELVSTLVDMVK